jgi:hypothetical protein
MNNIKEYKIVVPKGYRKIKLKDRDIWVEALRSGKYRQGEGMLAELVNKRYNYCCLGLRLKIQGRLVTSCGLGYDVLDPTRYQPGCYVEENPDYKILGPVGKFPEGVRVDGDLGSEKSLAELNDCGYTFKQIADIIERLYKNA